MNPERWQSIEKIFNAAIELAADDRSAYIEKVCEGDTELVSEIENLIAEHQNGSSFLSTPVLSLGLAAVNERSAEFAAGQKIGEFTIKKLLARGGMGDVYLAHDERLDRPVALKVLHSDNDSQNALRFEREARSASGIVHQNVVHIYDVGRLDGASYIAMEYVGGTSLRGLLKGGRLSNSKIVAIARQIADALAAAHAVGVVHRDIKPENIMLTEDRAVKVVDFGLAKQTNEPISLKNSNGFTTTPGMIMGTVGYMSPEQLRGEELDERTDIWSFGVVLYEMLYDERPFTGDSSADTISAILKDEPVIFEETSSDANDVVARIARRCLAKRPSERFQSAADLAFALSSIDNSSRIFVGAASDRSPGLSLKRFVLPAAAVLLISLLGYWAYAYFSGQGSETKTRLPRFSQITFDRGTVWSARFMPGGNSLVYGAAWNDPSVDIYSLTPPNTDSRKLGFPNTTLLSVSSRGEMAVLKNEKYLYQFLNRGTLGRVGAEGGAVREVAEDVQEADWSPDGNDLAIVRWADGINKLEFPIGKVLYERSGYINCPRFSPDGKQIAFFEHATQWDNRGDISIIDREGDRQTISTGWSGLEGLAWHGQEIWFTGSKRGEGYALYSIVPGEKNERLVASVPINLMLHDISANGRVLLSRAVQQTDVYLNQQHLVPERELSWLHLIGPADMADDGSAFIFTHFGEGSGVNYTVFLRKTDGSPAIRLGEGRAFALSHDGRFALAKLNEPEQLTILPVKAGETVALPKGNIERFDRGGWFRDGEHILFTGNEPGAAKRAFSQNIKSGEIKPLTPEGVSGTLLSPDDRALIVATQNGDKQIFDIGTGNLKSILGLESGEDVVRWTADGRAIFVHKPLEMPIRVVKIDLATGKRENVREIAPNSKGGVFGNIYLFLTPDGKTALYGLRRYLFNLYAADFLE